MLLDELLYFFLDECQMKKLTLIDEIYCKILPISQLEKKVGMHRKKLKRIIESLRIDIIEYKKNKELPDLEIYRDKIVFSEKLNDELYLQLRKFLKERYLNSSSIYKIFMYILGRREFSILQISKDLSYSQSYTYKNISKIKNFFLSKNLPISFLKISESKWVLKGEEVLVRLLYFCSATIIDSKYPIFFSPIQEEQVNYFRPFLNAEKINELSPANQKKLSLIMSIYESALISGYKLEPLPNSIKQIGNILYKKNKFLLDVNYLSEKNNIGKDTFSDELIQLVFILNYFIEEMQTFQEKIAIGKELSYNKRNSIINSCNKLIQKISEKNEISEDSYYYLVYSLSNQLIVIHYLGLYKLMCEKSIKRDPIIFIHELMINSFKEYKYKPSFEALVTSFSHVITGQLISNKKFILKIYIDFLNMSGSKHIVENSLTLTYNPNVLRIVEHYSDADLIVSDSYTSNKEQKYFYFNDIFDKSCWNRLNTILNETIKDRVLFHLGNM